MSINGHCCECERLALGRMTVTDAVEFMTDARPGEAKDAAEALIIAAFKHGLTHYEMSGVPKL